MGPGNKSGKNILLIVADDLGRNLGCYGEAAVHTPHLDGLARQGVLFDNAFTSTASCSGSRSVIYTGLHTHENGMYGLNHLHHHFCTFDHVETAPQLFNDIGYLTGIINKVHVGPAAVYPWQVKNESWTRDVSWSAQKAGEFFEKACNEEKPFFLTVGFIDPHRDDTRDGFGNTQEYPDTVTSNRVDPQDVRIPHYLNDLPSVRHELAEYFQSINRMDQGVGMLLAQLENAGMADNTLVVFVSDNGAPFLNSKSTLFDAGVHLPLIVRNPRGTKSGIVNPNLVSFIDILPTLLDWAGHGDKKGNRLGSSILPIMDSEDKNAEWSCVFGSHTFHELTNYWPTRFVRTERFKYHRNIAHQLDFPFSADLYGALSWEEMRNQKKVMIGKRTLENYVQRPAEELYDLEQDREEVVNVAGEPKYQDIVLQLREACEAWQRKTRDPWLIRDGVALIGVENHLRSGMRLPDRFDFDVKAPGNQNIAAYEGGFLEER